MKIYGYEKGDDRLLSLKEASIQCSIQEIDDIIEFLNNTKNVLAKGKVGIGHCHFRDYNEKWEKDDSDLIIVTKYDE